MTTTKHTTSTASLGDETLTALFNHYGIEQVHVWSKEEVDLIPAGIEKVIQANNQRSQEIVSALQDDQAIMLSLWSALTRELAARGYSPSGLANEVLVQTAEIV